MRLALFLYLLSWSDLATNAHVLHRRQTKQTKEEFDQQTTAFETSGLCRFYKGSKDSLATCATYCKKTTDITCIGASTVDNNVASLYDPDGDEFIMGKCDCKAPEVVKLIAEEVLKAMPVVAGIACTILFAVKGVEKAVSAAKTLVENGNDAAAFAGWFSDVCNPSGSAEVARINAEIGEIFDPLANAPDSVAVGAGCVRKDKSKCKNGGKPSETSKDRTPDATTKDAASSQTNKPSATTTDKASETTTDKASETTTDASKTTDTSSSTDSASSCPTTTTTSYQSASTDAVDICKISPDACKSADDLELADFADDTEPLQRREGFTFVKRSGSRDFDIELPNNEKIEMASVTYVERPAFVEELRMTTDKSLYNKAFDYSSTKLADVDCGPQALPVGAAISNFAVEHILELQTVKDFVKYAMTGDITALDSKTMSKWVAKIPKTGITAIGTKVISKDYFLKPWKEAVLAGKGLGKVGKGDQSPDTPAVRVFEALGSKSNKAAFLLLNSKTNSMKALIWGRKRGMAPKPFKDALAVSADPGKYSDSGRTGVAPTSNTLVSEWMSVFREVVGVYQYLNHKETKSRLWEEIDSVRTELENIEKFGPPDGAGLAKLWDSFVTSYFDKIEEKTKEWYNLYLKQAMTAFEKAKKHFDDDKAKRQKQCANGKRPNDEPTPQYIDWTLKAIAKYEKMGDKLKVPRKLDVGVDADMTLPKDTAADGSSSGSGTSTASNTGDFVQSGMGAIASNLVSVFWPGATGTPA